MLLSPLICFERNIFPGLPTRYRSNISHPTYILALCGTLLGLLTNCGSNISHPTFALYDSTYVIAVEEIRTQISRMGQRNIELRAPLQQENKNGDIIFPEGILITKYDSLNEEKSQMEADSGFFLAKENIYEAHGQVYLQNLQNNSNLSTEKLSWNPSTARVYTDKHVLINDQGHVHSGEGLSAAEDFSEYYILKPSGTLDIE